MLAKEHEKLQEFHNQNMEDKGEFFASYHGLRGTEVLKGSPV